MHLQYCLALDLVGGHRLHGIRGDYFGRASFGKILGISTVPMNVLLLVAAPMAGFMRDELGDYDLAFITLAGLNMVGAILFLVARKPKLTGNL
ncbi:MAG: hypothetical protein CM1200mP22_27170 [Dehalococcoidia bacterium]|nr:MAG: hypothetical protein CM1200mP22_27170 [Dehalococcoidia bacterium]